MAETISKVFGGQAQKGEKNERSTPVIPARTKEGQEANERALKEINKIWVQYFGHEIHPL